MAHQYLCENVLHQGGGGSGSTDGVCFYGEKGIDINSGVGAEVGKLIEKEVIPVRCDAGRGSKEVGQILVVAFVFAIAVAVGRGTVTQTLARSAPHDQMAANPSVQIDK